jgi:hypothetical protein
MNETTKRWSVSKWAEPFVWEGVDLSHTQPPTVHLGEVEAPTRGAAITEAVLRFHGVHAANLLVDPIQEKNNV